MKQAELDYLSGAAYHALKSFVSPVDLIQMNLWSHSQNTNWYRSNRNEQIEALYNSQDYGSIKRFSRKLLIRHFRRDVLLGYNSGFAHNKPNYKMNNGGHRLYKSLPYAPILNITGKREYAYNYNLLLVTMDLDVHKGEKDILELLNMLLQYFPESYHEPSTGGEGIHLYIKLAVHNDYNLSYIIDIINQLKDFLVDKKTALNISATLDKIAGLPTELVYDSNNKCTIKRHHAIKLPLFNHSYPETNMLDIYHFHNMPFYDLQHILEIINPTTITTAYISPSVMCSPTTRISNIKPKMQFSNIEYNTKVQELKNETDGLKKKRKFVLAYLQYLRVQTVGTFPTVELVVAEYNKQQLYNSIDSNNNDWQSIIDYWKIHYKPLNKPSVDISSFPAQKDGIINMLTPYIGQEDLIYKSSKRVKTEELALLYFFVQAQTNTAASDLSVSYRKIRALFQHFNMYSDKNKSSKMLQLLVKAGLIEKTDGYIKKKKGNSYRAVMPFIGEGDTKAAKDGGNRDRLVA